MSEGVTHCALIAEAEVRRQVSTTIVVAPAEQHEGTYGR